jgi:Transglycosylase SLT domain
MRRPRNRQPPRARSQAWLLKLRAAPLAFQLGAGVVVLVLLWFAANWVFQVARKPAELLFPVSGALNKMPAETWRQYESIFRGHSTAVITPELLAALAQVEGAGNPAARTYWRWRLTSEPFEVYRPASSAVGMYQITDGTFREARRYCIRDHAVIEDGPWNEWRSCWFNALYLRVLPSHAVELTAALLDRRVAETLRRHKIGSVALQKKQDLAAVIHLCGGGGGDAYVKRNFQLSGGQRCGAHDVRGYLARVNAMKQLFARLAKNGNEASL